MNKNRIIIIGAGGHGKVLAETVSLLGKHKIIGFADDRVKLGTKVFQDIQVLCTFNGINAFSKQAEYFFVALGNNTLRESMYNNALKLFKPVTFIHPNAFVAPSTRIDEGSVVLAGAVVSSCCMVGKNTIINSLALVDHDSIIGDHCHIAQGAIVGSNSYFASRKFTEIGQVFPSFSKV